MDFTLRNLSVLAYANGFTLWHYKAAACGLVSAPGFFDAASGMLAAGDMMMVSAADGARMLCVVPDGDEVRVAPLAG
jgi:hypothetical protein